MAYIYLIEFPNHPNLAYVGKTTRPGLTRIQEHFHSNKTKSKTDKLCRWYKTNNIQTINTILEEADNVDWLEIFYIRYLKFLGFELTNHTDEETISISWTEDRKKKHSELKKQFRFTTESKQKMSNSKMGRGVTWGDKISKSKTGKPNPFSETHLFNLQEARKKSHGRSIVQTDLNGNEIQTFNMILDAANHLLNTTHNHLKLSGLRNGIKDCCVGKQKTCAGFKWKYKI
jgi:hypothetical protein